VCIREVIPLYNWERGYISDTAVGFVLCLGYHTKH
jgi:hypothetical protein